MVICLHDKNPKGLKKSFVITAQREVSFFYHLRELLLLLFASAPHSPSQHRVFDPVGLPFSTG